MSGGSPHELYDSMGLRPRMRLYFLNIGARLKNSVKNKSSEHCLSALFTKLIGLTGLCLFFLKKIDHIYNVSPV